MTPDIVKQDEELLNLRQLEDERPEWPPVADDEDEDLDLDLDEPTDAEAVDVDDTPPKVRQVMSDIRQTLDDIESGTHRRHYPAVERILNPSSPRDDYARTMCTPDCPARTNHQYTPPPSPSRRLIADIRPPMRERVAIIEHEIDDINQILGTHNEMIIAASTKEDMHQHKLEADRRVNSLHTRLDIEVLPKIETLSKRRFLKDWVAGVALTISLIYSLLLTYDKLFR